ncbi:MULTISPECIES: hypothetical protein [unclassified Saccharopolyspora]|uniref:hypothetical protein n=1 Tax=unclassified Saccharopolyspora TaxID=2646250 RepID=UPI001CD63993|nr:MULTISPECIES: hypothetical protein [unclassified Saccharopolyspora]MCA1194498.1 hypothetical protein [Saccharopolyspora sp. 6V]MCA1228714.1 hypothetical protein [Saccharopolyspora sp. 6M]
MFAKRLVLVEVIVTLSSRMDLSREGDRVALDGVGFHVELGVLDAAAGSIRAAVREQDGRELGELPGAADEYGDDVLATAMSEFCEHWSSAIDDLVAEGDEMAEALAASAASYREADAAAVEVLRQDPAVDAVDG